MSLPIFSILTPTILLSIKAFEPKICIAKVSFKI